MIGTVNFHAGDRVVRTAAAPTTGSTTIGVFPDVAIAEGTRGEVDHLHVSRDGCVTVWVRWNYVKLNLPYHADELDRLAAEES